jgi:hypothetical protein
MKIYVYLDIFVFRRDCLDDEVSICIYIYIYTYIYIFIHIFIYAHMLIKMCIYMFIYVFSRDFLGIVNADQLINADHPKTGTL